ncbi:hypothetical protein, partial [Mesorhizobium sp.]|uniref:hypothetical protein n=1 Tax=Mesorhizobium sp. TaxID=1871066 RepID=UPI0025C322A1
MTGAIPGKAFGALRPECKQDTSSASHPAGRRALAFRQGPAAKPSLIAGPGGPIPMKLEDYNGFCA